jgi:hypothetical protein
MNISDLIPLIGQLLKLSVDIAAKIDQIDNISIEDKEAMKAHIRAARDSVTYWD